MKRVISLATAVLAAVALVTFPSAVEAAAGGGQDSASGTADNVGACAVFFCPIPPVTGSLSFSAHATAIDTSASGTMKFTNSNTDPNTRVAGTVTCMSVVQNTALVAGILTQGFPFGNIFSGTTTFFIQASDTGKFSPAYDTVRLLFGYGAPPPDGGCSAIPGDPNPTANISIVDALP